MSFTGFAGGAGGGSSPAELALHEEFLLLCLHDNKGAIRSGKCRLGIAGALAAEMFFQDLIAIDRSRRRKPVVANPSRWLNDPVLNDCLQQMRRWKPQMPLAAWMLVLGYGEWIEHRIAERLRWRGILRMEEKFSFMQFSLKRYPEINPDPKREVIERLREAIFSDAGNVSPRTAVLASLANSCDLLKSVFGREELRPHQVRLAQLAKGQLIGGMVVSSVSAANSIVVGAGTLVSVGITAFGIGSAIWEKLEWLWK